MLHTFNAAAAKAYKNGAQKARVLTELWVFEHSYCPSCGARHLQKYPNNKEVADFYCGECGEDFELKSKKEKFGSRVVDGEHKAMLRRLQSDKNPNFFLLAYGGTSLTVKDYIVVPKHFFVPAIIEKRKPLAPTAERSGWTGCNINLSRIPESGKVFIVKGGHDVPRKDVLQRWKRTLFLRESGSLPEKGWTLDVMRCLESLRKESFSLDEVYGFEAALARLHPENNHVKDKIRQQLQVLRDAGHLVFEATRGRYRLRK